MVRGRGRGFRTPNRRGSIVYVPVESTAIKRQPTRQPLNGFTTPYGFRRSMYRYPSYTPKMTPLFRNYLPRRVMLPRARRLGPPMVDDGGYYVYQPAFSGRLRRRQSVMLDRRRRAVYLAGRRALTSSQSAPAVSAPSSSSQVKFQVKKSTPSRPLRIGNRRNRPRGRNSKAPVTKSDLNAQLDAYMGDNATKSRLNCELDSYFGRVGAQQNGVDHDPAQDKHEPMSDPSDVTMGAPPTRP